MSPVCLCDKSAEALQAAADELGTIWPEQEIITFVSDVTDIEESERLANEIEGRGPYVASAKAKDPAEAAEEARRAKEGDAAEGARLDAEVKEKCDALMRTAEPLGSDVTGIDHTPLDQMWEGCRERSMCLHLWQYAHEIVSARPVELLALDYRGALQAHTFDPTALSSRRNVAMQLAAGADTVDAVAVSVEFDLRPPDGRGAEAVGHDQLSQHSRREVFLLPQHARRVGDATLHFAVLIEDGALRLDFGAE